MDKAWQLLYLREDRGENLCLTEIGEDVGLRDAGMCAAYYQEEF